MELTFSKPKRGMTGRHGNHHRGFREATERVRIVCELCSGSREYKASEMRVRKLIRFCSRACWRLSRPKKRVEVRCVQCGTPAQRRPDKVKVVNFCSRACAAKASSKPKKTLAERNGLPPWSGGGREYMRVYLKRRAQLTRALTHEEGAATWQDWLVVLSVHDGKCARCGATERIECDHIVPVSKGGKHVKNNLQPLCRHCNRVKGASLE